MTTERTGKRVARKKGKCSPDFPTFAPFKRKLHKATVRNGKTRDHLQKRGKR